MNEVLLVILLAQCLALFVAGLSGRGRIYEFPFLIAVVVLGWAVPQLIGLTNDPFLPPGALAKTLVMTNLCVAMTWVGFNRPTSPMTFGADRLDTRRIAAASLVLSLVGAYFFYKISVLSAQFADNNHQWTGIAVAYDFFSRVLTYGFVLALLVYLRTRSRLALAVLLFDSIFYFHRIFIAGRRWGMIEFTIALGVGLWLYRRIIPPRVAIIAGLVGGVLVVNGIGQYRALSLDPNGARWSDLGKLDLVGNFTHILENGSWELHNATLSIEAVDRRSSYDYGAFNWNMLVFNFVPSQIFGERFKKALRIDTGTVEPAYQEFQYTPYNGTTMTGMYDSFRSFSYFGCLKFFIIALLLRKLYNGAWSGDLGSQAFYIVLTGPGVQAITHHTQFFFSVFVHMALFVIPVLWLSRTSPPGLRAQNAAGLGTVAGLGGQGLPQGSRP